MKIICYDNIVERKDTIMHLPIILGITVVSGLTFIAFKGKKRRR